MRWSRFPSDWRWRVVAFASTMSLGLYFTTLPYHQYSARGMFLIAFLVVFRTGLDWRRAPRTDQAPASRDVGEPDPPVTPGQLR